MAQRSHRPAHVADHFEQVRHAAPIFRGLRHQPGGGIIYQCYMKRLARSFGSDTHYLLSCPGLAIPGHLASAKTERIIITSESVMNEGPLEKHGTIIAAVSRTTSPIEDNYIQKGIVVNRTYSRGYISTYSSRPHPVMITHRHQQVPVLEPAIWHASMPHGKQIIQRAGFQSSL